MTQGQIKQTTLAIAEAIRELGEVPSGVLYAQIMSQMTIDTYNAIIKMLIGAGLVSQKNFLLTWVGPHGK